MLMQEAMEEALEKALKRDCVIQLDLQVLPMWLDHALWSSGR